MTLTQNSILSMIKERFEERLLADLKETLSTVDRSRAYIVRSGLLQSTPTNGTGVNILVHANDPSSPGTWEHTVVGSKDVVEFPSKIAYQMGDEDTEFWWRRFKVEARLFLHPSMSRTDAQQHAETVQSRIEHSLRKSMLPTAVGPDSFNEAAVSVRLVASEFLEGGGEGQFIWDGYVLVQVLTWKG